MIPYMRIIGLVFLFLFSSFSSIEALEKLILHFDINKTILSSDVATGKTTDDIILHGLAEKYKDRWEEGIAEPISYADYVKLQIPGSDTEARTLRSLQTSAFLEFLYENGHSYLPKVENEFNALRSKIKRNGEIFPSFYKLIHYLDEEEIDYSIILRTFGIDIDRVVRMVNHKMSTQFFSSKGKFNGERLCLDCGYASSEMADIYKFFKNGSHLALQDNWHEWNAHQMHKDFGKRFPVDLEDQNIVSMFFDDNILLDPASTKNVISPVDAKTGRPLNFDILIKNQHIVSVDTLEALGDDDYFIKKVKAAIGR